MVNVKSEEEEGMHEALEQCVEQLQHVRIFQEIALLQQFFQIHKQEPSKIVTGPAAVSDAVENKRAKWLLMYEDLKVRILYIL